MRIRTRPLALLAIMTLLFMLNQCSKAPLEKPAELKADGGQSNLSQISTDTIEQFTFENGLRLIVQEDRTSPVVSLQAWVPAGSITEDKLLGSGISHALEHMLFKGTERRGVSALAEEVQSVGGYVNAYTTFDRTVYFIESPSYGWKTSLDVLADAIFHSSVPQDEFVKEQEVIRREFAMGQDSPDRVLSKLLFSTAYVTHPCRNPVIGYLDLFNKLTRDDLYNYYRRHYVPNNLTFIIVGDVDAQAVRDELEKHTNSIERGFIPDVFIPSEPSQLGRREQIKKFPTDVARVISSYQIPAITDPDLYPLDVLAIVAGHGRSSRLYLELAEKEKLVRDINASSYTPAHSGLWAVSVTLLPGDSDVYKIEQRIKEILEDFKVNPVNKDELEKAKRQVLVGRAQELKTVSGKASSLGMSWFTARDLYFDDNYLDGIRHVTAEDIMRVASKYFIPEKQTLVALLPQDEDQENEKSTPSSEKAEIELHQLSNGIPVVLLKDSKIPLVTLRACVLGGLLSETPETNGISQLISRLLNKGTRNMNAEQIAQTIERIGGNLALESGNNSLSGAVEVLDTDLPLAAEILSEVMLHPTFPEDEIDKERQKQITDLKLELDQPVALARNELRSLLFGLHPYGLKPLGSKESLETINRETLMNYHKKLLAQNNFTLAIGGSFDSDEAIALLEKTFGSIRLGQEVNYKSKDLSQNFSKTHLGKIKHLPTDKVQAIVTIGYPAITIDSPDRAALEIIDQALSGQASRLFKRIREDQALAYFVGTGLLAGIDPGYFMFYAGTRPDAGEKVQTEMIEEIKEILNKGFTEEEINRARSQILGRRILQDQAAATRVYKAALYQLYGLGTDFDFKLNEKIKEIPIEEVNRTFKKYFSDENYVSVIVQPENKK